MSCRTSSEAIPLSCEAEALLADPAPTDPAELCQQRKTQHALTATLPSEIGPEAHILIERYLVGNAPLNTLAADLDLTPGQLWHCWRKTLRYLREQLNNDFTRPVSPL